MATRSCDSPQKNLLADIFIYFILLGIKSNGTTIDASVRIGHRALALPTGIASVNFGADYRHNSLARHLDERRFADGSLAADPIRYLGRAIERYSIFGEVQAPLLPAKWLPRGWAVVLFRRAKMGVELGIKN